MQGREREREYSKLFLASQVSDCYTIASPSHFAGLIQYMSLLFYKKPPIKLHL